MPRFMMNEPIVTEKGWLSNIRQETSSLSHPPFISPFHSASLHTQVPNPQSPIPNPTPTPPPSVPVSCNHTDDLWLLSYSVRESVIIDPAQRRAVPELAGESVLRDITSSSPPSFSSPSPLPQSRAEPAEPPNHQTTKPPEPPNRQTAKPPKKIPPPARFVNSPPTTSSFALSSDANPLAAFLLLPNYSPSMTCLALPLPYITSHLTPYHHPQSHTHLTYLPPDLPYPPTSNDYLQLFTLPFLTLPYLALPCLALRWIPILCSCTGPVLSNLLDRKSVV